MTTTPTTTPNVPAPAGAVDVDAWDKSIPGRSFTGRSWVIAGAGWHPDDIDVYIHGIQSFNGEVERTIVAGNLHPDNPITSAQARQLARALLVQELVRRAPRPSTRQRSQRSVR